MSETREQVSFGWPEEARGAGEERRRTLAQRPSSSPPLRGGAEDHPTRAAPLPPAARDASLPRAEALPPDNELWDVHATARFLKRSVSWVYHKAEDGTLPVKRLGGWGLRFIPSELRAWVEAGVARPGRT